MSSLIAYLVWVTLGEFLMWLIGAVVCLLAAPQLLLAAVSLVHANQLPLQIL